MTNFSCLAIMALSVALAQPTLAEDLTYEEFLLLPEGSPDLSWVMLDCVQGIDYGQILDGCRTLIERSDGLMAAGSKLITAGNLTPDQLAKVEELMHRATSFLVIGHKTRAYVFDEVAKLDCEASMSIAQASKDPSLVSLAKGCP